MSWPKRPKVVWRSQAELIQVWLGRGMGEGRCRGWGSDHTALSFKGESLYSHHDGVSAQAEIARLVQGVNGERVLLVQWKEGLYYCARKYRQKALLHWFKHVIPAEMARFAVTSFEEPAANQAWYGERVRARYGTWKRARVEYIKR